MCLNKTKPFNLKYNCLTDIYIYMCVISAEEIFNIDFFSTSLDVHNLKLLWEFVWDARISIVHKNEDKLNRIILNDKKNNSNTLN